jgi:hypothetical protein
MSEWVTLMPLIWVSGFVLSVVAIIAAHDRMERVPESAFGRLADWYALTWGFAVFPILGLICGAVLLRLATTHHERKQP